MKNRFYDWNKTLSFDAPVTMVIGARGIGKTYGIRKQAIRDYLRNGRRFVEISRFKEEMKVMERNYFDRIGKEFPQYAFKIENNCAWIALRAENKKNQQWDMIGYFIAMSSFQMLKKATFNKVKRIIMDECVIEKNDRYHRYLPDEWAELANIISSVTRERPDDNDPPRLYLLGNACDIINPYFEHLRLSGVPPRGYTWYDGKNFLLHYPDDKAYVRGMETTLAGSMLRGSDVENVTISNLFVNQELSMLGKKTAASKYLCTFAFKKREIAVWVDEKFGYYYINGKTPRNMHSTYALTLEEQPNYPVLKRRMPLLQTMGTAYRMRLCRFDTPNSHGVFRDMLTYVGL